MNESSNIVVWKFSVAFIAIFLIGLLAAAIMSYTGLAEMVHVWGYREEYGHGYIIPFIALFLIWQKKTIIEQTEFSGSWVGVLIVFLGCLIVFVGNLTTITTIIQYGALIVLFGLIYSFSGKPIKLVFIPLLFLVFMIPLPGFFLNNLSSKLQLISSEIGVAVIRLFDISVFLEGNVIDLGEFKLQVVEACSGLNYLFPLMSIAFMAAYFFKAPFWQRAVIFITSVPITVLMNSFRIGVIGVLVDNWGIEQAEGFLHDFEGWVIFMACLAILLLEMWVFIGFSEGNKRLEDVFAIELPEDHPANAQIHTRGISKPFLVSIATIIIAAVVSVQIEKREELIPERKEFIGFPSEVDIWKGRTGSIKANTLKVLKLSDYIISDYSGPEGTVNFYVAYYKSQRGGASAHSPRSCIPGGGWEIKSFNNKIIDGVHVNEKPLEVNRLLIKKGDDGQLVYYWFHQRDRIITNEYMVKWYLFWDALTKNRTDGALVRITTHINHYENIDDGDKRLTEFARSIQPYLSEYIPD